MDTKANSQTIEVPLEGKVALLFHGAHGGGRSLAVSLAKYGADIAIVYNQIYSDRAEETKNRVEAEGRNCLIMPAQINDESFSEEVVRQTINSLGRLDIFIDYSSFSDESEIGQTNEIEPAKAFRPINKASSLPLLEEGDSDHHTQKGLFTNIELMSAALDQIVHLDRTNTADDESSKKRSKKEMRVAKELVNKPIISVNEGQELGKVQDFYLDQDLTHLVAIYLGSEGLLSRKETLIKWPDVVTLGQDAILVKDADCVTETAEVEEIESYMRRDDLNGRPVDTPGGTKIGRIGDIVLDDEAKVAGYSLAQIFVSGPVATNRAISRAAVVDTGNEDGVMTADLSEAEKANLQVVHEGLFADPSVTPTKSKEASAEA